MSADKCPFCGGSGWYMLRPCDVCDPHGKAVQSPNAERAAEIERLKAELKAANDLLAALAGKAAP